MKRLKRLKLQVVTAVGVLLLCVAVAHAAVPMPKFSLAAVNKKGTVDSASLAGKVLLVEFSGSW